MRVLHLITRFLDGGAETTTLNTIDTLKSSDANYDIRLGTGGEHDPNRLENLNIKSVVFDSLRHYAPVSAVFAVGSIARYLHSEEIDVLHTHSTEAGVVGRLAGLLAGTPVIIHEVHGDPITDDRPWLFNQFLLTSERLCARFSNRIVVKSERIRETYLKRDIGQPNQYKLIYHGVDIEQFRTATPSSVPADNCTTLLYVGRLADGKGLYDLLTALNRLHQPSVELLIAGEGPERAGLEAKAEAHGLPTHFLGYREDVPALMAGADVLVLPSYREGTPRVVTEALASGTAVVATNVAGIPEQVADGETGRLIEPGDVEALSTVLADVVENPKKWELMGNRARESVAKFRLSRASEAYRKLYRSITPD
ncbi:glycosyltransferase family 4 protein [Halobaculum halobium]|uniref:Glycosyltransferase family 4 protein n=1 Tax=Halobaculum halobium TaxID=3032281 RepID=A0ABD5TI21_9EURY|nr:glycosyltransferase family 4 protein [Halobaculum sp. SYNS20]